MGSLGIVLLIFGIIWVCKRRIALVCRFPFPVTLQLERSIQVSPSSLHRSLETSLFLFQVKSAMSVVLMGQLRTITMLVFLFLVLQHLRLQLVLPYQSVILDLK